jgi:hypothetical protein
MTQRRKLPSVSAIRAYWEPKLQEADIGWDGGCFACGMQVPVDRCHILPRVFGGPDTVDNLHLLCRRCHFESEALSGDAYWDWFINYANGFMHWEAQKRSQRLSEDILAALGKRWGKLAAADQSKLFGRWVRMREIRDNRLRQYEPMIVGWLAEDCLEQFWSPRALECLRIAA